MASISIDLTQRSLKKKLQNTASNGYPVVTIQDNFNIEVKPNIFYNIKNNADSEININFNPEEFYSTGTDKILLFTFDNVNEITSLFLEVSEYIGIVFKKDTSKEGYKYKSVIDLSSEGYGTAIIYAKSYPTSGEDLEICVSNDVVGLDNFEITLTNVIVFNEYIDSIVQLEVFDTQLYGLCIKEVENDNVKFKHKYHIYINGGYDAMSGELCHGRRGHTGIFSGSHTRSCERIYRCRPGRIPATLCTGIFCSDF